MEVRCSISIQLLLLLTGYTSAWKKPAGISTAYQQEVPVVISTGSDSWVQGGSAQYGVPILTGETSDAETILLESVDNSPLSSSAVSWPLEQFDQGEQLLDLEGQKYVEIKDVNQAPLINHDSQFSWSAVKSGESDLFLDRSKEAIGEVIIEAVDQSPLLDSGSAYSWLFDKPGQNEFLDLVAESVGGEQIQTNMDSVNEQLQLGTLGSKFDKFKWPIVYQNFDNVLVSESAKSNMKKFKLPKLDLPNIKTVIEEEESEVIPVQLPKLELPKMEKGPVKEIPIHVYRLPPWPQLPKMEIPKLEPVKELPLVMYEFPPLPEVKPMPLPEMKLPELRIEKYILPPLPKFKVPELPKIAPLKEIPIVLYEFPKPDIKPLELPKIEPIKEIPIVMYDLPPLPKMKPIELPKIKMPEIKIIKKKLPPLPKIKPIELPKLDLKLPEIKVVKYEMPKAKPFEFPKMPDIKFVKYEMPSVEKPKLPEFKLPEIKLPEIKPIKLPEFKLPELKLPEFKPLELPKLPEIKIPEVYPMVMPPVQYMYAPVPTYPMPFPYQLVTFPQPGKGLNFMGLKSKFMGSNLPPAQPVLINSGSSIGGEMFQSQSISDQLNSQYIINQMMANQAGGSGGLSGFIGGHPTYQTHPWGSQVLVIAGNDAVLQASGENSKVLSANGNTGLKFDTVAPWTQHYSPFVNAEYENIGNWYGGIDKILSAKKDKEETVEIKKEDIVETSAPAPLPSKDIALEAVGGISIGNLDKDISVGLKLIENSPISIQGIREENIIESDKDTLSIDKQEFSANEDVRDLAITGTQTSPTLAGVQNLLAEDLEKDSALLEGMKDVAGEVLEASGEEIKNLISAGDNQNDLNQNIKDSTLSIADLTEPSVPESKKDVSEANEDLSMVT